LPTSEVYHVAGPVDEGGHQIRRGAPNDLDFQDAESDGKQTSILLMQVLKSDCGTFVTVFSKPAV